MKYILGIVGILAILLFFSWKWIKVALASDYDSMLQSLYSNSVPLVKTQEIDSLSDYVILDTRAFAEYEVSHLENAIWVGYPEPNLDTLEKAANDQAILVYCSVGYRSEKVGEMLQKKGFTKVYNLYGGIFEWANKGKKLINSPNKNTQKVHGFSPQWSKWLDKNIEVVYE